MLNSTKVMKTFLVAGLLMISSQVTVVKAGTPASEKNQSSIVDVALTKDGAFQGKVVNTSNEVMANSEVVISQANKEVARTVTNTEGKFSVNNLSNGVYKVSTNEGYGYYRVWETSYAPPVAQKSATIISGNQVIRGQTAGQITGTVVGLGAVGGGTYGIIKGLDNEDKVTSP